MKDKMIIAIVGLPGSGKTEVVKYLVSKYGWPKVYFPEAVFDEMRKRGMEMTQANEKLIREELRETGGLRIFSERAIAKIKDIEAEVVLAESMYSWEEYQNFREEYGKNFYVLAVYAPPKIRYARLQARVNERPLEPEEAEKRDYAQIERLFQAGPIAMADFTVVNIGSKEDLEAGIEEALRVFGATI